jgi:hypothetical protein
MSQQPDFQIGDLITSYWAGYHIVTDIQPEFGNNGLIWGYKVTMDTIMSRAFKIYKKPRSRVCSSQWCKLLTKDVIEEIRNKEIDKLSNGYNYLWMKAPR